MNIAKHTLDAQPAVPRLMQLQAYLASDPRNPRLLREVMNEALSCAAHEIALDALDTLESLGLAQGDDAAAYLYALIAGGQAQEAAARAKRALAIWPADEAIRLEGARALLMLRQFDEALAWVQESFQNDVHAQTATEIQQLCYWNLLRLSEALDVGQSGIHRWPNQARLMSITSAVLFDMNRMPEAFKLAAQAYELSADTADEALPVLASACLLQGQVEDAAQWITQAAKRRPNDSRVRLIAAAIALAERNSDHAVEDLKLAAAELPDHPGTLLILGWMYLTRHALDEAESYIRQAIAASPAFGESHGSLAVIYALCGQPDKAKQSIRRASLLDREGLSARYAQHLLDGGQPERLQDLVQDVVNRLALVK